jgi:hypothetical protein
VVGCDAVHVDGLLGDSAEEVSAADDDSNLAPESVDGCDLGGHSLNEYGVNAETCACGKGFSGEFEEDSFVHVKTKYRTVLGGGLHLRSMQTVEGLSTMDRPSVYLRCVWTNLRAFWSYLPSLFPETT